MYSWLGSLFAWIGSKTGAWGWLLKIAIIVVIIGFFVGAFGSIHSCQYNRANKKFQARDAEREKQSAALKARADASDAAAAQWRAKAQALDGKVAAFEALGEDKKRLDENLTAKIDEVVKHGQEVDAATNAPSDCGTRAERTCANFRKLKIDIDCAAYKQRICAAAGPTSSPCNK